MLTSAPFRAGVIKDDPVYSSQGYAVDSDKIRWVRGSAQAMGGYTDALGGELAAGTCYGLITWNDNVGTPWVALGTTRKLYASADGALYDITPLRATGTLENAFSTTDGSAVVGVAHVGHGLKTGDTVHIWGADTVGGITPGGGAGTLATDPFLAVEGSEVVTVSHAGHGLSSGDLATFSGAAAVGGVTVDGQYTVHVVDADTYYVRSPAAATSTASGGGTPSHLYGRAYTATVVDSGSYTITLATAATSTVSGDGDCSYAYELSGGLEDGFASSGYGTGPYGAGPYSLSATAANKADVRPRTWSIQNWGQNLLANPLGGTIYEWNLDWSQRATPVSNAPAQVDCIVVSPERYLLALGCTMTDSVYDPLGIRWTEPQDNTVWTPSNTNLAGEDRLARGSGIVGAIAAPGGLMIWTDDALYGGRNTGSIDQVWAFDFVSAGCGLIGPHAAVESDGTAYWMSPSGFHTYAGGKPKQIPSPVRRHVFESLVAEQGYKVQAYFDSAFQSVSWSYPSGGAGKAVDRYVRLDLLEQSDADSGWSVGTTTMTAWVDRGATSYPVSIRNDGMVCFQDVGTSANGAAIARHVEFAPIELAGGDEGNGTHVLNISRATLDSVGSGAVRLTLKARRWPTSPETVKGPYLVAPNTPYVDLRVQGRQIGLRLESNGTNDFWRLGSLRLDMSHGPRR